MRSSRLAAAGGVVLAGLVAAACGSAEGPGWTYQPAASVTPAPSGGASGEPSGSAAASGGAEPSASAGGSAEPSASAGGSAAPSGGGGGEQLAVAAQNIQFDVKELSTAADTPFQIVFDNRENVPHDVDIRGTDGSVVADNPIQPTQGQITYDIPALAAGEYQFICSVHPIEPMTGTLTVE